MSNVLKFDRSALERHLQAAKATVVEVAKTAWEKSSIVKAIITYVDKLSEAPNQGD